VSHAVPGSGRRERSVALALPCVRRAAGSSETPYLYTALLTLKDAVGLVIEVIPSRSGSAPSRSARAPARERTGDLVKGVNATSTAPTPALCRAGMDVARHRVD